MLTERLRKEVWEEADTYYSERDWAHGKQHVERVVRMSKKIGRAEGADLKIIELAAILHDIFAAKEPRAKKEGFRHDVEGAREARRILGRLGVDSDTIAAVAHCIEAHRKRSGAEPRTIEAKCLFDGDKLDALGGIGVIRAAFVGFENGQEFFRKVDDIEAYKKENVRPDGRIIDFVRHSSNLEYEISLRLIPGRLYTETGRRLAKERAAFMDEFFDRIGKEMSGVL
jgi:uncharacterized protein